MLNPIIADCQAAREMTTNQKEGPAHMVKVHSSLNWSWKQAITRPET